MTVAPQPPPRRYHYLTDGDEIYRLSFATIRSHTDLSGFSPEAESVAVRVVHAAGDPKIAAQIDMHPQLVGAARTALAGGAPILADSAMLAAGVTRRRLPADNQVICTLRDPAVPNLAAVWGTTRAAAAVSLWQPHLPGAIVAIGNAPTALFHLLEMIADGAPRPAAIVGIPVGFVGSAESKRALADFRFSDGSQIPYLVVHGNRGGSAMAAAAVNALTSTSERA